jgi:hypothetical protein
MLVAVTVLGQDIDPAAKQQIADILAAKDNFTAAQQKIDSNLVFAAMAARGDASVQSFSGAISPGGVDNAGNVTVDIQGSASPSLAGAIALVGGTVLDNSVQQGLTHATVPLWALETLAGREDVLNIQAAPGLMHSGISAAFRRAPRRNGGVVARTGVAFAGSLTSQGYIAHAANTEVSQGFDGTGVTVGVLSDSASAARVAALIASGDLPANTTVLAGQAGPSTGSDEGTAMMEIVHDLAPGANLMFATADNGVASFAANIIALQQTGCKVIVDDVTYFNEGAFQDGPIARAVSQVVAAGAVYFSSAANSGNLTLGTSGTWEGDFADGGPAGPPISPSHTGELHNFGTVASPQTFDILTAGSTFISLKWSDPLGGSTNDYDLFVLNSTGTTVTAFSATAQTGTQDPYEAVSSSTGFAAGSRIVVVQHSGAARALRVDTNRGRLSIGTAGSTFGHNAGIDTISTAATYWNSARTGTRPFTGAANPIESFSSDGPRKIFYFPNGTAITPGNLLFGTGGGTTVQKPDLTAADGITARTPGFSPFFGTSAAAPHAAAIAALIFQARPTYTPAQVKAAMTAGSLDNMAPGVDRDSGSGIVMATLAVQYALTH